MQERIAAYLTHRMPAARSMQIEGLRRIPGGASRETWSFDASWEEDHAPCRGGFILRRDPDASLLVTEREREYTIYQALDGTAVPVPRARWLEPDPCWLDRPFFIMDRIDGCQTSGDLLAGPEYEAVRPTVAARKMQILAALHALDWRALGLDVLSPPEAAAECAGRELAHWRSIITAEALEPQPVLEAAMAWLAANLPPPASRIVLVHGDYRTGNFLYNSQGQILGVLDWEMAHLGDPMEDLAWLAMRSWRYRHPQLAGGLLPRAELFKLYEQAGGVPVHEGAIRWWEVLGNLKLAGIFLTGARSFVEGRTTEIMMALVGRMLPPLEAEILDLLEW